MAKSKTPGTPDPAKKSKPKGGTHGAKTPPAQIFGVDATQVFQGLPNSDSFPRTEAGLYDYLRQGGMPQDAMESILTDPDGAAAVTSLQSWVKDPANKFRFADDSQQSVDLEAGPRRPGEGRKPGEKKKRSAAYVPTDPVNMEAKIAAAMRGTGVGGTPTKVTTIQGAKGQWKHVVEFAQPNGTTGVVEVPADAPATADTPKGEKAQAQPQPAKPAPMTYDERVAAKKKSYEDAGKNPPLWMGATQAVAHGAAAVGRHLYQNSPTYGPLAIAGAVGGGYGLYQGLKGGGQQQQQQPPMEMSQQDIDRLNRSSMEMFGIPYKPSFQPPQPQAQPQPQAPQPQIPAGMPSDDQTTLLLRLAKSRSV